MTEDRVGGTAALLVHKSRVQSVQLRARLEEGRQQQLYRFQAILQIGVHSALLSKDRAMNLRQELRIERDPAFWEAIAAHPACAHARLTAEPAAIGALALRPDILPLAAEHGGYLFRKLDLLGLAAEVHSLFTPAGWGREAVAAGLLALQAIFATGYQSVLTYELEANGRSRPPKAVGFAPAWGWRETPLGAVRLWVLTRRAFEDSRVGKDMACQRQ
ncbi:MAG: hypothetical protein ACRED8_03805 [Caulobacteraceae bacterium]